MILTVILISVVISFIYWYFVASYNHWRNRNIPGPKPKLFHGNFPSLVKKNRNVVEDFMDIYETYHNREPIIGIYVLRHPELMVLDPELVKDILVKYQRKFGENFFSYTIDKNDKLFGPNLFFLHQNEWKSKRQELSSGFAVNKIKAQFDNIHQIAQDFCKYIKTQSKSQNSSTFEVKSISIRYTAEIASSVVFGVQGNSFTEDDPAILSVSSNLIPFSVAEQILNYFKRIYLLPFLARFTKTRISIKSVEAFYEKLTIDVLRQRQNDGTVRNDYVDHMLQLMKKKGLNEVDMTGDFINLFLDTFETTSIFMSNVLFEIARHPEVQNRIREEISALEDKKLDFESVESLEYLENVIFGKNFPVSTN
uniref:CSON002172 protein n=1 Tax=Culicoides sonorensis TaxID=179676 RepID=A0A336LWG8_CULSO